MSYVYSSLRRFAAFLAVGATLTGSAHAATITVNSASDAAVNDGNCTLREAVRAANTNAAVDLCAAGDADGDVILIATATSISLTGGEIRITDDVTVRGPGTTRITINAGGLSRIFDVDAASGAGSVKRVQFLNLVLQNGNSSAGNSSAPDAGGAVDLKGGSQATFTNVDVTGSVCGINGGGIHGGGMTDIVITTNETGTSTIRNNEAKGPESNRGGGGVWGAGAVTITGNVLIDANRATGAAGSGGGVFNLAGTLTIGTGVVISNNTANRAGGGIESADGTVALTGVVLRGNNAGTAPGNGGGFHGGGLARVTVDGGTVTANTAVEGGGLWISLGGTLTVTGTAITANTATGAEADQGGGGVYNDGGRTTLATTTITGNKATGAAGSGGGVLTKGVLTVTGGTISTNTSVRAGGGIEVVATPGVALSSATVSGNTAGTSPGFGGGVHITGAGVVTATGGTYSGNTAVEGGGFWKAAPGSLTISNATISTNTATGAAADQGGGGVYSDGGAGLTITGGSIIGNKATGAAGSGGGVFNNTGSVSITGTAISNNTANRAGGGVEDNAGSGFTLSNVTLDGNNAGTAPGNGGGLHISGAGTVTVTGGSVLNNTAVEGGGLWKSGAGTLRVSGTTINTNTATGAAADQGGGAIYNDGAGGTLTVTNATIVGNRATGTSGSGGGLLNNTGGVSTVTGTTFRGNASNRAGGAIEDNAGGSLMIVRGTFSNNTTGSNPGNGGALHITGASVVSVDSSLVDSNRAANEGGGLWNSGVGQLTVQRTMIHNNTSGTGGGLYQVAGAKGLIWLSQSAVTANSATAAGGGLAADGATIVVRNTTVSGNTAPRGAGLASGGGRFLVSNATIARNAATTSGGGLFRAVSQTDSTLISLDNSIVADNTAPTGADAFGVVTSRGYNLIETTAGATIRRAGAANTDITGVDPGLQPLAENGGPTRTHAVAAGSRAIGAGMTSLVVDQRGFPRGSRSTIGAFEFGSMVVAGEDTPSVATEFALALAGPNPFRSRTTLRVSTPTAEAVDVVLFDALGRRVQSLYAGTPGAGATVDVALEAATLAPGLYFVRMTSASATATQRVTITR